MKLDQETRTVGRWGVAVILTVFVSLIAHLPALNPTPEMKTTRCRELAAAILVANFELWSLSEGLLLATDADDRALMNELAWKLYASGQKRLLLTPVQGAYVPCDQRIVTSRPDVLAMFRMTVGNPAAIFENKTLARALASQVIEMVEGDQPAIDAVLGKEEP